MRHNGKFSSVSTPPIARIDAFSAFFKIYTIIYDYLIKPVEFCGPLHKHKIFSQKLKNKFANVQSTRTFLGAIFADLPGNSQNVRDLLKITERF